MYLNHYKINMLIKKYEIDGIPVEIRIEEDTISNKEKLLLLLDALKMQIDTEYEKTILNKDKEKLKEYERYIYLIICYRKILTEMIEFESHQAESKLSKRKRHKG